MFSRVHQNLVERRSFTTMMQDTGRLRAIRTPIFEEGLLMLLTEILFWFFISSEEMLVTIYFLFLLGLGLSQEQEPHTSNPDTSTTRRSNPASGFDTKFDPKDFDFDENDFIWSLQKSITFSLLRDSMKLLAKMDGTTLKSVWNILNNMRSSRIFLDILFYEFLSDFAGEEFDFSPEIIQELSSANDRLSYKMVHRTGTLGTPKEDLRTVSFEESDLANENWETLFPDQEYLMFPGDDEYVSNFVDEPCENNKYPIQVGSIRGIPGEDFPDYIDIPMTFFSCAGRKRIPGFYADLDTGCQVFHVCWPHRRESFLCPVGTVFNQAILACDYWYSVNCSLAPLYYDNDPFAYEDEAPTATTESLIDDILEKTTGRVPTDFHASTTEHYTEYIPKNDESYFENEDLKTVMKFLPIKSKITSYSRPVEPEISISTSVPTEFKESITKEKKIESGTKSDVSDGLLLKDVLGIADKAAKDTMKLVAKLHSVDTRHRMPVKMVPEYELHAKHIPLIVKKPIAPVIPAEKPLVKINPRFIVKPAFKEVTYKKIKVKPLLKSKLGKPIKSHKGHFIKSLEPSKEHLPEILSKSFQLASGVLHDGILPLTRKILMESYAKQSKVNKH
ncbi:chitin-binding type-2 domain-containing protein [Nephila pilipes]|uniref:Chitin-binding type-2 domain-containing protein n=1 Tax=Nephila pilipes TaxID=299642 RepID=A0A8X6T7J9_NEPPI|nr:chitin-binding type-2 domain-containing protein [Nephila pilipes]